MNKNTLLGGLALALSLPTTAHAWCRTTTDQRTPSTPTECITTGTPLYWSRRCQTFSIDAAAGGGLDANTVRSVVGTSFSAWTAVDCGMGPVFDILAAPDVTCDEAKYNKEGGNANVVAFASDFAARMYPTDAIAVTIVWHNPSTGFVYDADMIVNEAMGPFVNCGLACGPTETHFDLRNVVTHEAGHFLGLSHSADANATMYYRADPGETSKRSLAQDDIDGLCAIYGAGTLPSSCDPTPRHGFFGTACADSSAASDKGCGCSLAGRPSEGGYGVLASIAAALAALRLKGSRRRIRGS